MKSRLGIFLLLFVLNSEGVASNIVGAGLVPARVFCLIKEKHEQGRALPLQINSLSGFTSLSPDGVATSQQRRRRRRRKVQRRTKVYGIKMTPDEMGASPPPPPPEALPQEAPNVGASQPSPQARPGMAAPGRSAPPKRSAPRIKPPTVQIKPPTR
jgi:hypothetical protein